MTVTALKSKNRPVQIVIGVALVLLMACSSKVQVADESSSSVDGLQSQYRCTDPQALPTATETFRLTKLEYRNTLISLMGESIFNDTAINRAYGFIPSDYDEGARIPKGTQSAHIDNYLEVGMNIGRLLVSDQNLRAQKIASCATTLPLSQDCLLSIASNFAQRVFRRPLTDSEKAGVVDVYNAYSGTAQEKFEVLIGYLLSSPKFLYHFELDGTDIDTSINLYEISEYALANRLSYALWGTMPDDALFASAANGRLSDDEGLKSEILRLLADPKAKKHLGQFYGDWLRYQEIPDFGFPDSFAGDINQDQLRFSMMEELRQYVDYVTWDLNGGFHELMTSTKTFIPDEDIAKIYNTTETGEFDVNPDERVGLLGKPGILARISGKSFSRPIYRGVFVLENFLCSPPSLPSSDIIPEGAVTPIVDDDPMETTRDKVAETTSAPTCMGCHSTINNIGFALESFDDFGRRQDAEEIYSADGTHGDPVPVDPSVNFDLFDSSIATSKTVDFIHELGRMSKGYDCMNQKWLEYVAKRHIAESDHCALESMFTKLVGSDADSGGSIQEMIVESLMRPENRLRRAR